MLRVLTLSTLFPNAAQPTFGIFVERQTRGLAELPDTEVQVVAPIGVPPWPLSRHPHYRARAALPREEQWKGLCVHRPHFPVLPIIGDRLSAAAMARKLLPFLRALRTHFPFDVIDAEFFWPDGPAAMRLTQALGVPFSIKARGGDINHWSARPAIRRQLVAGSFQAGGMLAVSAQLRTAMTALGMPGDRIAVHYTGIDLDRFRPTDRAAAKQALNISGPLLLTAGALIPRKGQRLAIEALTQLPDATLLLVGEGPDRRVLEQLAIRMGVAMRTRFLGNRPHEELARYMAAADVLVHPSASEGLANVWVEALACGTPVVAGRIGGADEIINTPAAGRLVPLQSEAIAAAVREILADPPDPDRCRAAASRFRWDKNAEQLRAHLAAVAARG